MDLGRYQQGQTASLLLLTRDADGNPALPDAAPQAKVLGPAATVVRELTMPIWEELGVFHFPLFLNQLFVAGWHQILYYYRVGSYHGREEDGLTVVPGGSTKGSVISMYFFRRPHADYVLQQRESGVVTAGKNPTL